MARFRQARINSRELSFHADSACIDRESRENAEAERDPVRQGGSLFDLSMAKATIKTVKGHQYYVFPTAPPLMRIRMPVPRHMLHSNLLTTYNGKGSNASAKLIPEVHDAANAMMTALIRYGEKINDWSMRNAVIQSGYRPDDASQGWTIFESSKRRSGRNQRSSGRSSSRAAWKQRRRVYSGGVVIQDGPRSSNTWQPQRVGTLIWRGLCSGSWTGSMRPGARTHMLRVWCSP